MVTHVLLKHQYVMFGSLGKQGTLCSMSKCKMDKPRIVSWACNEVWQFKMVENKVKMAWLGPRTDPGRARAPGPIFLFYLLYFSFFFSCASLSYQSSQPNPISNYSTKKINKNNKSIHNGDFILAKKLFYHQRTKNHVLLEKLKLNFLQL